MIKQTYYLYFNAVILIYLLVIHHPTVLILFQQQQQQQQQQVRGKSRTTKLASKRTQPPHTYPPKRSHLPILFHLRVRPAHERKKKATHECLSSLLPLFASRHFPASSNSTKIKTLIQPLSLRIASHCKVGLVNENVAPSPQQKE